MDAATIGLAQQEDREWGIDQEDIFDRVILFLALSQIFVWNRFEVSRPSWGEDYEARA
jgi:hypothetical protein